MWVKRAVPTRKLGTLLKGAVFVLAAISVFGGFAFCRLTPQDDAATPRRASRLAIGADAPYGGDAFRDSDFEVQLDANAQGAEEAQRVSHQLERADDPDPPDTSGSEGSRSGDSDSGRANDDVSEGARRARSEEAGRLYDRNGDGIITVNEFFDRVFYVNVNAEQGRRDRMRAALRLAGVHAERFPALTMRDPSLKAQYQAYLARPIGLYEQRRGGEKLLQSEGAFAYLKTCEKIIGTARARSYRRILLLDDDVRFHANFTAEFDRKVRMLPRDWKLLYLGASQHGWHDRAITWTLGGEFYHPLVTDGSFAVGIDVSLFELLAFEISKESHAFDSGALRAALVAHHNDSFVAFPNLVVADVSGSLIRGPRNVSEYAERFRWRLSDYTYDVDPDPLPRVCVVMPLFNAPPEVMVLAMRSLLAQTYAGLEIVVVTHVADTTWIRTAIDGDPRVRIVRSDERVGLYAARNAGLRRCTAPIFTAHSAGDIASPDRIALQIAPILDNRADLTYAYSLRLTGAHQRVPANELRQRLFESAISNSLPPDRAEPLLRDRCCGAGGSRVDVGTVMARMSVLEAIGGFDAIAKAPSGDEEWAERYIAHTLQQFMAEGTFDVGPYLERRVAVRTYFEVVRQLVCIATTMQAPNFQQVVYRTSYRKRIRQRYGDPKAVDYNPF